MINDVAFGQYYPVKSPVHRMDPRMKIVLLITYIVMIFVVKNFWGFLLAAGFLLVAIFLSRVPVLSVVKSVKAIVFIIVLTFIINLFLHKEEGARVLVDVWLLRNITDKSLFYALFMAMRLSFLVFGSSLLTLTTTPVSLTDGLEALLKPLKIVRFPVHELALIMSIALRFIPTLMEETNRIISAQKARGADFDSGNLIKKAKALLPVLIPLIISAFRRADELGDAMDARCYNGSKNRTKYKKLKLSVNDLIAALFTAAILAGIILCNVYLGSIL